MASVGKRKASPRGVAEGGGSSGGGGKIALVSLGCPKNLVDLQVVASALRGAGFDVGVPEGEADAILVNTCAFIESARQEALDAIEEACARKADPRCPCRAVIVSGCLPQRYRGAVFEACPEVDAVLGVDDLDAAPDVVRRALDAPGGALDAVSPGRSRKLFTAREPWFVLTPGPYAYLKIGEGCRHACAFCAIPGIRGRLRSRPADALVAEAEALLGNGIKELDVIAQDVTSYGMDFRDGTTLASLLRRLDALPGRFRIRLLYGHPARCTDELLDTVAASRHVVPYFDIPVQHASPAVLRAMDRRDTVAFVPDMARRIRERVPGAVLRTTCLVGFPGETRKDFEELLAYVAETRFDHLGAFVFSPEEGTKAASMPGQVPERTARRRRDRLMQLQAGIVAENLDRLVGSEETVLLETPPARRGGAWTGRCARQAPDDIDGVTRVRDLPATAKVGDFVRCRVVGHTDYDLLAKPLPAIQP